jgi:hypothetical protein
VRPEDTERGAEPEEKLAGSGQGVDADADANRERARKSFIGLVGGVII